MQAEEDPQAGSVRHGSVTPTGMGGRAKKIFCISQLSATVTGHEDCIQAVKVTCRENMKDGHAENFESTVKTLFVFLKGTVAGNLSVRSSRRRYQQVDSKLRAPLKLTFKPTKNKDT